MSDQRTSWSYTDDTGAPKTEPITIQDETWAPAAITSEKRDPDGRTASNPRTDGWKDQTPYGDEHNWIFQLFSLFLKEIESRGIIYWSALTDYAPPAVVTASDGNLYVSRQPSGPGGAGAKDPIAQIAYWQLLIPPRKSPSGLVINQYGPDPAQKFDISPGVASASNQIGNLYLNSPLMKNLASTWSAGNGGGARFSGVPLASGWLHVFLIRKDSDGSVDAGCDLGTSLTPANIPAGYTAYKRIGSLQIDTSNIVQFDNKERAGGAIEYFPFTMITQSFTGALPVGRQLLTLPIPLGIIPKANITAILRTVAAVTTNAVHITPTFQNVRTAAELNAVLRVNPASQFSVSTFDIAVDNVGQISWEISLNQNVTFLSFTTRSWIDDRLD